MYVNILEYSIEENYLETRSLKLKLPRKCSSTRKVQKKLFFFLIVEFPTNDGNWKSWKMSSGVPFYNCFCVFHGETCLFVISMKIWWILFRFFEHLIMAIAFEKHPLWISIMDYWCLMMLFLLFTLILFMLSFKSN